jgi:hypothetical protein
MERIRSKNELEKIRNKINTVNEEYIYEYFGENIKKHIKKIMILDDEKIHLHGLTTGKIGGAHVKGWKNMWYGKYYILHDLVKSNIKYEQVINMRIDFFGEYVYSRHYSDFNNNIVNFDYITTRLIDMYINNKQFTFMVDDISLGIDNIYISSPNKMLQLTKLFHETLDNIKKEYHYITNQEHVVYHMAKKLFG